MSWPKNGKLVQSGKKKLVRYTSGRFILPRKNWVQCLATSLSKAEKPKKRFLCLYGNSGYSLTVQWHDDAGIANLKSRISRASKNTIRTLFRRFPLDGQRKRLLRTIPKKNLFNRSGVQQATKRKPPRRWRWFWYNKCSCVGRKQN